MKNYYYSMDELISFYRSEIDEVVEDVASEVLEMLREMIINDTYISTPSTQYDRTYEFLKAFILSTIHTTSTMSYVDIEYDSSSMSVISDVGYAEWTTHASVVNKEDVREELIDILNVDGTTSTIDKTIRRPYLDNFIEWLDNNYVSVVVKHLSKRGIS